MPTEVFWNLTGAGIMIFFILLPFSLSDKWRKK
jgi:hypothetical protein